MCKISLAISAVTFSAFVFDCHLRVCEHYQTLMRDVIIETNFLLHGICEINAFPTAYSLHGTTWQIVGNLSCPWPFESTWI